MIDDFLTTTRIYSSLLHRGGGLKVLSFFYISLLSKHNDITGNRNVMLRYNINNPPCLLVGRLGRLQVPVERLGDS